MTLPFIEAMPDDFAIGQVHSQVEKYLAQVTLKDFQSVNVNADIELDTFYNVRLLVDSTGGPITVTLNPLAETFQKVRIVDAGGAAATNNITIIGTIDGATNYTISTNNEAKEMVYTGVEWRTTGDFATYNPATDVFEFANDVSIVSGTGSTSTGTGALVVSGGVGISENLHVGGTLNLPLPDGPVAMDGGTLSPLAFGPPPYDYVAVANNPVAQASLTLGTITLDTLFTPLIRDVGGIINLSTSGATRLGLTDATTTVTNDLLVSLTSTFTGEVDILNNLDVVGLTTTADARIENLNTGDNLLMTDTDGDVLESGVTAADAPVGGSGFAVFEYAGAPSAPPTGFIWVQAVNATTKSLNYFDGTDTFSVELGV